MDKINLYISSFHANFIPLDVLDIIKFYIYDLYYLDILSIYKLKIYINEKSIIDDFSYSNLSRIINLNILLTHKYLNEDFIKKYLPFFNENCYKLLLLKHQIISHKLFESHFSDTSLNIRLLSYYNNKKNYISEKFIIKYLNHFSINDILTKCPDIKISDKLITQYESSINIKHLIRYRYLSDLLIHKYHNKLDWSYYKSQYFIYNIITYYPKFNHYFNKNLKIWNNIISKNKKILSLSFINTHHNKLNWTNVINCVNYIIPIKLLNLYISEISFNNIYNINSLPYKFIDKYYNSFNWPLIISKSKLNNDILQKYLINSNKNNIYLSLNRKYFYRYCNCNNLEFLLLNNPEKIKWTCNIYKIFPKKYLSNIKNYISYIRLSDFQYRFLNKKFNDKLFKIDIHDSSSEKLDIVHFFLCIFNKYVSYDYLYNHRNIINYYINYITGNKYNGFIKKYMNKENFINWDIISNKYDLSIIFLDLCKNKLNWSIISKHIHIDINHLSKFKFYLNWDIISTRMDPKLLYNFKNYINWDKYIQYNILDVSDLKLINKINWDIIIKYQSKYNLQNYIVNANYLFNNKKLYYYLDKYYKKYLITNEINNYNNFIIKVIHYTDIIYYKNFLYLNIKDLKNVYMTFLK